MQGNAVEGRTPPPVGGGLATAGRGRAVGGAVEAGGRVRRGVGRAGYTRALTIRVTPAEQRELGRRARAAGMSVSRLVVESALAREAPPDPAARERFDAALFHLRRVETDLERVARRLDGDPAAPTGALAEALRAAAAASEQLRASA